MEKRNPIKFKVVKEDGYYAYHLPIITQLGILEYTIQECNIDFDLIFKLQNEVGIYSGFNFYDDPYLYSLMLRYLLQDNKNIMVTSLIEEIQKEYGKKVYDLEIFESHWSNRIEYSYDSRGDSTFSEFGFINNRKYKATFLENKLLKFFYKTYHGDVTSWCFLSGKDLKNTQNKLMDSTKQPKVKELFNEVETMVTLQLGDNEGYEGYVLIYSKSDISDKIKKMEKMIIDFGTRYENFLPKIEKMVDNSSNEEIFLKIKKFLDDFDVEYGLS